MSLRIRFRNVYGEAPDDHADVHVIDVRTESLAGRRTNHRTPSTLAFTAVDPGVAYKVKIYPLKHRPVSHVVRVDKSGKGALDAVLPIHPDHVMGTTFPDYDQLDAELKIVLERGGIEDHSQKGKALYDGLGPLMKAGLLNVWTKMGHTLLPEGLAASNYVESFYRVRGDRFFANVSRSFRDVVKTATAAGLFESVDGSLHTPPDGFGPAGSFKSKDGYGNLQLTFFSSASTPLAFKLDADIDDANGIEHVFQVLDHWITDSETHPYDIHQILMKHQGLDPAYQIRTA
ncbi:MAG TPA: hypothetical protein VJ921_15025 [Vicinamibacteria bacterium]|nr:hypothetical protein [Vicinamibacteria bacterium]